MDHVSPSGVGGTPQDPRVSDVAERGRRLFEFLAHAQRLRSTPVRTTEEEAAPGFVLWFHDLPVHSAVRIGSATTGSDPDAPLLTVDRPPTAVAPPEPSTELREWLGHGDLANPNEEPLLGEDAPDPAVDPDLMAEHEAWLNRWREWAAVERTERAVRALYRRLFAALQNGGGATEELELILAVGCLSWRPGGHDLVKRHLLTRPAAIRFDDASGCLSVTRQATVDSLRLELDMLNPSLTAGCPQINEVRERARTLAESPLHRVAIGDLIRPLVLGLSPDGEYRDSDVPTAAEQSPVVSFAPALILRRRSQRGLIEIFDTIGAEISATGQVPSGLMPLLDPDFTPPTWSDRSPGAMVTVDEEIILPLPLNRVQLDVITRVDSHAQTVVQGPPGTGKTHTAAALLTHLLAQGKRVLVTAHTDRALQEVRSKLPPLIKPLAVSVVGSAHADLADLQVAVETIADKAAAHDPEAAQLAVQHCLDRIETGRRERADLRARLYKARQDEVTPTAFGTAEGTLARIAETYQAGSARYGWISPLVDASMFSPDMQPESAITSHEALTWLGLLRSERLQADAAEAALRAPDLGDLPGPDDFAALVDAEADGAALTAQHGTPDPELLAGVRRLGPAERVELRAGMNDLARRAEALERDQAVWLNTALRDIRAGRGDTWAARAERIHRLIATARPVVEAVGVATQVSVAEHADRGRLTSLATRLRDHVRQSGPVRTGPDGCPRIGAFSKKVIKEARDVFEQTKVDGQIPSTSPQLDALLAFLEGERQLEALGKAWPLEVSIPQEDTLWERLQWHATELGLLDRVLDLGRVLAGHSSRLSEWGLAQPDWNDVGQVLAYAHLTDAAAAHDEHEAARTAIECHAETISRVQAWADHTPTVDDLASAVERRDRDAYARAHTRIQQLLAVRAEVEHRRTLSDRLVTVAADLVDAVRATPGDPAWDDRLGTLAEAWAWARTGAWLSAQESVDVNVLQAQIDAVESVLRRDVEVLAQTRAWSHAVSPTRITGRSRADLTHYAQLVRRHGKGTGKYAGARIAEIRVAMERCRPAVPVWIMPIYRISEQLRVSRDMFDVVIVDEASQAGLEAVFLQYLAPKIVVIGDDLQVSPSAVGVDQQQMRDLANQYLGGDRYKASWQDPKRSLFDEASMRYGAKLTLVEHRRCVPEIIGFSNRIAYEPHNIRLVPVRQYGADRLSPIRSVLVENGRESSGTAKVNEAEARALVDQLRACLDDARYDGLTFGVISLLGTAQAARIERLLMDEVSMEEWRARDLRCGDAAAFQGSERDVMFLSMVSAPEPGKRLGLLAGEAAVQRFNVAVSRAKDQVWVFHSITLEQVPRSDDMRHHLLDHCRLVAARGNAPEACELVPENERVDPFGSLFEQRVFNRIVDRGHVVIPQFEVNGYFIDLVVVGSRTRLAIECDGDSWHGPEAYERDLRRQRDLERAGWRFFRVREHEWYGNPLSVLRRLWQTLDRLGIRPTPIAPDPTTPVDVEADPADFPAAADAAASPVPPGTAEPSADALAIGRPLPDVLEMVLPSSPVRSAYDAAASDGAGRIGPAPKPNRPGVAPMGVNDNGGEGTTSTPADRLIADGLRREGEGDPTGAAQAYESVIRSGDPEQGPRAAVLLGLLREAAGDRSGAIEAYELGIASGHPFHAPLAALNLAEIMESEGHVERAAQAYQVVRQSGDPDYAAEAAVSLGMILEAEGRVPEAAEAYEWAVRSAHTDQSPRAATRLARIREAQGDVRGAMDAYRNAADSGNPDLAPAAAIRLGDLLKGHAALDQAAQAYRVAMDGDHSDWTPRAANRLALLLKSQGDVAGAADAYRMAMDSGHPEEAPWAAVWLGRMRLAQDDRDAASRAFRTAQRSGHTACARWATLALDTLNQTA